MIVVKDGCRLSRLSDVRVDSEKDPVHDGD